jgi:tol-pal system protein YbgF
MPRRSSRITTTALAAVLCASLAPGCFWATTKSEGKALRKDVDSLDARVAKKEGDLDGKVEQLKAVLDEATKLLKRNSAGLGADVQAMQDEQRVLRGLVTAAKTYADEIKSAVDSHTDRLTLLEQRIAALEGKAATPPPASADELWNQGRTAFEAGRHEEAREVFQRLAVQFPQHERADDAQYFRGESHYGQKDYEAAIREYQKVFDKYADSALADDALFRAGEAAQLLKNCTEARAYFGLLRQKYPKSTLVKKAGDKDKDIKADAKNKAKCAS